MKIRKFVFGNKVQYPGNISYSAELNMYNLALTE